MLFKKLLSLLTPNPDRVDRELRSSFAADPTGCQQRQAAQLAYAESERFAGTSAAQAVIDTPDLNDRLAAQINRSKAKGLPGVRLDSFFPFECMDSRPRAVTAFTHVADHIKREFPEIKAIEIAPINYVGGPQEFIADGVAGMFQKDPTNQDYAQLVHH